MIARMQQPTTENQGGVRAWYDRVTRAGGAGFLFQTARTMLLMRLHGVSVRLVTCQGWLPVIHGGGNCQLGVVALRARTAAIELGAIRGGTLVIGDNVFINQGASIVAHNDIRIGNDCRIGDYVAIYDTDHHPLEQGDETRTAPVLVGRNVWIGRGAIVLPGVTIGDHAVVAAGTVVTSDVTERTLAAGNPAREIRRLTASDTWRRP